MKVYLLQDYEDIIDVYFDDITLYLLYNEKYNTEYKSTKALLNTQRLNLLEFDVSELTPDNMFKFIFNNSKILKKYVDDVIYDERDITIVMDARGIPTDDMIECYSEIDSMYTKVKKEINTISPDLHNISNKEK